jgi:hypothetical protein
MKKMILKHRFAKNLIRNAIFTFRIEKSGMSRRQQAPRICPNGVTAGSFHENATERRQSGPSSRAIRP